jgi:hypothetical protein
MKKSLLCLLFCFILVYLASGVFASVSIEVIQPIGALDVIKGQTFNVLVNVSCSDSDCDNVLAGLKIPNLQTKTFTFSDTTPNDCFGGTCLKAPGGWVSINVSGNANWGCGKCFSNPLWMGPILANISKTKNPNGCVANMTAVTGANLCLETDDGEKWDILFSNWPREGDGDFIYFRSIERGLLDTSSSTPFYLDSGDNPLVLSLDAGSSELLNFSVKASGNIDSYSNLVAFVSDQESSPLTINIIDTPIVITPNVTESDTSSKNSHHSSSSRDVDSGSISITEGSEASAVGVINNIESVELTGNAVKNNSKGIAPLLLWLGLGLVFVVLLSVFIILVFKRRNRFY